MAKETKTKNKGNKYHHLSPLEIQAISDARARGVKVNDLVKQYGVSRQSIYNAIRASKEAEARSASLECNDTGAAPRPKRRRSKRITPETEQAIADMKRKYPAWGVDYLREQWARAGNPLLSRASIYRILREAGLQTRQLVEKETFQRFEMVRPGQLYQMDIEGKIYLTGIGWVYGFAVLDDHSRFCPAFRYCADMMLSNGILVLNKAIEKHGVPEAMYLDNGSQFKSQGERLNNFELFCAAHGIAIVNTTPGRPEGKGKIERFYETVENQFITWVRARIKDGVKYTLEQLNKELDEWLQSQYHVRVHGTTKETPLARFSKEHLGIPDPPVDVAKYLERSTTRRVSKTGEVSYEGYKVQVTLPAHSRVIVVETIETIRIEYGGGLHREINKHDLTKETRVKHQNGLNVAKEDSQAKPITEPAVTEKRPPRKLIIWSQDKDGFYHRTINPQGYFKHMTIKYFVGIAHAGKPVLVQVVENKLHVFNEQKELIRTLEQRGKPKQ
jgi:transposase InsO family protein